MTRKHVSAQQLGLAEGLARGKDGALFEWLVASVLFAKPIQQAIAVQAYRVMNRTKLDRSCSPSRLL